MKKILLFGGSFDPIHNAHIQIAEIAYQTIDADKCYFVLAKNPRWKTPTTTSKQRLKMLRLGLKGHRHFKVSLIEYHSKNETTYTYDTITRLKRRKNRKYYYLIGSDQLDLLDQWYKIDELSKMVQFLVFRRAGNELNLNNLKKYNCQLIESKEFDVSSTKIRFLNKLDCPKKVLDYIEKNELYYTTILKNYINSKRLNHSFSVANLAYDIALSNKKDALKAYHSGLMHDIAKNISKDDAKKLMIEHYPEYVDSIGSWGYHQFLAIIIARDIFKIEDDEILQAIEFHATGKAHMSPLAKIIFCADKLDPSRGWNSKELIKECKKDYKNGFKLVLKDNIDYLKSHNKEYNNILTEECINYYLESEE